MSLYNNSILRFLVFEFPTLGVSLVQKSWYLSVHVKGTYSYVATSHKFDGTHHSSGVHDNILLILKENSSLQE